MTTGPGSQGPPPGWYPDPHHGGQQRYWNGTGWTEHTSGVQQMPPQGPPPTGAPYGGPPPVVGPGQQPPRKQSNTGKWVAGGVGAFVVIAVIANASGTSTDDGGDKGNNGPKTAQTSKSQNKKKSASKKKTAKKKANEDPEKPNNATDDYTPHVGANAQVTVDGIVYSVESVRQAKSIGDATIGTDEQASGTYVIADISAHSTKGESATLTDETFKVTYKGGPEYSADTDGTVALQLSGDNGGSDPFFLTDIQPDGDERGKVVFDVPDAAIGKKLELRVNELGFGSTHGFVRLRL
jgi:hypothetical protein